MATAPVVLRTATETDVPVILELIQALAAYERLSDDCVATEAQLRSTLFGAARAAEVVLADAGDGEIAGFALFCSNYSTFLAQPGIWLEDLFVRPAHRGAGIGRQLLARLAALAVERGCGRVEWAVLDWNTPSIGFYQSLGATGLGQWTTFRLTGQAMTELAGSVA
ncbi:MAG TPA: GNAT family N-acetyltransferase [Gemmatimonadaceae bacterium]|nr:GNAT family N-acetyltransferase [Gemmatimonadaceae bacterium]